jgi:hypothetical protein
VGERILGGGRRMAAVPRKIRENNIRRILICIGRGMQKTGLSDRHC